MHMINLGLEISEVKRSRNMDVAVYAKVVETVVFLKLVFWFDFLIS